MNARALHILCVEDHRETAEALCKLLGGEGHHVTSASSLATAPEGRASAEPRRGR